MGKTGRADEGLGLMEEVLQLAHDEDENCYLAELYRVKGELLIQAHDVELKPVFISL